MTSSDCHQPLDFVTFQKTPSTSDLNFERNFVSMLSLLRAADSLRWKLSVVKSLFFTMTERNCRSASWAHTWPRPGISKKTIILSVLSRCLMDSWPTTKMSKDRQTINRESASDSWLLLIRAANRFPPRHTSQQLCTTGASTGKSKLYCSTVWRTSIVIVFILWHKWK